MTEEKDASTSSDSGSEPEIAELEKCRAERDEYLAGWQRAKADFLNYKRDENQRLEEISKFQTTEILLELVRVLDHFDLGLRVLEKNGEVDKGIYLIRNQIEDILKRSGVIRLPLKEGDVFDPNLAEAITEDHSESPPGCILQIIEPGYKLHDKLLRPARVKVSRGPEAGNDKGQISDGKEKG